MGILSLSTILFSVNVLLFNFCAVFSDEVPVVLWNIKGDAMQVKPISALGHDDTVFAETLKEVFQNDANILLFSVNKLSLEDFSSSEKPLSSNNTLQNLQKFLDTQSYMIMSSVKNPMKHVHEAHCGVQEIVVDQSIDDNILQSIAVAFQRSCVVILHITDAGVAGIIDPKMDDIQKVFLPSFEKTPKKIVGIFTAMKSSWGNSNEEERHMLRNLLEAEEAEADDDNFIKVKECLIAYALNATIFALNKTVNLPITKDIASESDCSNSTAKLVLSFKPSDTFTSVVVTFDFNITTGSWVSKANLVTTGGKSNFDVELVNKDMSAPLGFSFSCGKYELRNRNSSNLVKFTINRFQVQPFAVKGNRFGESFDCVTWFTIPIWMGIFVSLLFIFITNCGIFALYSVKTMDRFDDPKGKTITVAASAD